ncbi:subclass B3 metallo-beta-lactamase [Mucilaginibacter sp. UR6-1]|uniref:subclass B3 metallo-beta-lactamase n=1 Tax=Mucilaginibacter sp. UR6-1 TaxID=1435643 RepID=UPI001E50314E|nr:subclass B3 metallo-beta-lactamase [Mucilaginibacter sp. UR6-1]MCC8409396.1 subclass B3 metallo-beta-lactamase [Mucilaginibacter sp. UR6-1]
MLHSLLKTTLLIALFAFTAFSASAQKVIEPKDTPAEWSKPYQPFRIAGNLYYVGTYDLASYLVVTPKGNILINTGLANSADIIKKNIATLGFKFKDIKILLTTQAHYDHLGAMAAVKKQTGAKMMVDEADAQVMADGGSSDYALGNGVSTYVPIKADRILHDKDSIILGDTKLTMLHHPGHTKGSCSFLLDVKDAVRTYRVLIANMPSIVTEKKFGEVSEYPAIEKDYAYTFDAMKKLSFDIWVSSHASQFNLHTKHKPGDTYNPAAFIDLKGYDTYLAELDVEFKKKRAE